MKFDLSKLIRKRRLRKDRADRRNRRSRLLRASIEQLEDRRLLAFDTPILNFPGQFSDPVDLTMSIDPPDTVGDVGRNYYIQAVNDIDGTKVEIFNKRDGSVAREPFLLDSLLIDPSTTQIIPATSCATGLGDPQVSYDHLANRWVLLEFADSSGGGTGGGGGAVTLPEALCVYVSKTSNPLGGGFFGQGGGWNFYEFSTELEFPDYPKLSVWPDGYYVSTNEQPGVPTPSAYVLDRENMLKGLAPRTDGVGRPYQRFQAMELDGFGFQSFTPSDLDGPAPPPGTPNYFARHIDDELHRGTAADPAIDFIEIYAFRTDWDEPRLSTFEFVDEVAVRDFNSDISGITQPLGGPDLDPLREVIMHRMQYRNFGTHQTLVGNFVTDVNGDDRAGIQWFELRSVPGDDDEWFRYQEGIVSPDLNHRWMGSIAMDGEGNIAMGYSISSEVISPSLRYIGRRFDDPLGTMTRGEYPIINGIGKIDSDRNGDYSALVVDPVNDSTFWFTGEFARLDEWSTQITTFEFDEEDDSTTDPPPPSDDIFVTGTKFLDRNENGIRDFVDLNGNNIQENGEPFVAEEPGLSGVWIYVDEDRDQRPDAGETKTQTDINGEYRLPLPEPGTYHIREVLDPGFVQTFPGGVGTHIVTAVPSQFAQIIERIDFGNQVALDFGDAPVDYPVTLAQGGAQHRIIQGFGLGAVVDGEVDGQPTNDASGDDLNGTIDPVAGVSDDEDGVAISGPFFIGTTNSVNVTVTTGGISPGVLDAWIDFNRDGDWTDAGEQIVASRPLAAGTHAVSFVVPDGSNVGNTYARFRYSHVIGLGPAGEAGSGEVEDYEVLVLTNEPRAVNDEFTVLQNSIANNFQVLSNDFASSVGSIFITQAGPSAVGSVITIGPGGQNIFYTPRDGFFGVDTFTYTISDGNNSDSATVTVNVLPSFVNPVAVDNTFSVQENSQANQFDVLGNDIAGLNGPVAIVAVGPSSAGGVAVPINNGSSLLYTPAPGTGTTDQFSYTIADTLGNISTATVTVHVLPGDELDNQVDVIVEAFDLNDVPLQGAVQVGDQFKIRVSVLDKRSFPLEEGVFSAYTDVLFDAFRVVFDSVSFNNSLYPNGQNLSLTIPGILDEVGAFSGQGNVPKGPVTLFETTFTAAVPGTVDFIADPADDLPLHEVALKPNDQVPIELVGYGSTQVQIVGSGFGGPIAVDNSFTINSGVVAQFDVLKNDKGGSTGVKELVFVQQPINGIVSIADPNDTPNDPTDDVIEYNPNGFTGTEQFSYTLGNDTGLTSLATVTVHVQPSTADDILEISLLVNGSTTANVSQGEEVVVDIFVTDVRGFFATGPFSTYFDLLYDDELFDVNASATNPLGFAVEFGPEFPEVQRGDPTVGGIIDEFGAVTDSQTPFSNPNDSFLLASVTFTASTENTGTADFVSDPANVIPPDETTVFGLNNPLAPRQIRFNTAQITVLNGNPEPAPFQNNLNSLDVNNDNTVSPIDALIVINDMNANGTRSLANDLASPLAGEPNLPPSGTYVDVNGDNRLSPIDALMVINSLNNSLASEPEFGSTNLAAHFAPRQSDPLATDAASPVIPPSFTPSPNFSRSAANENVMLLAANNETDSVATEFVASATTRRQAHESLSRVPATAAKSEIDDLLSDSFVEDILLGWSESMAD